MSVLPHKLALVQAKHMLAVHFSKAAIEASQSLTL